MHACIFDKKNYKSFAPSPLHARYRSLLRLYSHMVTVTRPRSQSCMHDNNEMQQACRACRDTAAPTQRRRSTAGIGKSYFASSNFHENLIFLLQLQNRSYDLLQFFKTGQLSSLTSFEAEVIMVLILFWIFHMCKFRSNKV